MFEKRTVQIDFEHPERFKQLLLDLIFAYLTSPEVALKAEISETPPFHKLRRKEARRVLHENEPYGITFSHSLVQVNSREFLIISHKKLGSGTFGRVKEMLDLRIVLIDSGVQFVPIPPEKALLWKLQKLNPAKETFDQFQERVAREYQITCIVNSETYHLPMGEKQGIITHRAPGKELLPQMLTAYRSKSLSDESKLLIIYRIVQALEELHLKNILHRDFNARNIILDLETYQPVIIDFGLSIIVPINSHPSYARQDIQKLPGIIKNILGVVFFQSEYDRIIAEKPILNTILEGSAAGQLNTSDIMRMLGLEIKHPMENLDLRLLTNPVCLVSETDSTSSELSLTDGDELLDESSSLEFALNEFNTDEPSDTVPAVTFGLRPSKVNACLSTLFCSKTKLQNREASSLESKTEFVV